MIVMKDRTKLLFSIALPIAVQNLISFAVNLMDTVMLGQLGETPLAASSLANQVFFVVTVVVYGIGGGANVLAAQYWGRKDLTSIYRILDYTYRTALVFALSTGALAVGMPGVLMRMFTHDEAVVKLGIEYLRIVGWSYLLFTASAVTLCVLRAAHIVRIALILSCVSLCVNAVLNYLLIFGKAGMPRLGITGAAIATLSARAAEFFLLLLFLWKKERSLCLGRYFTAGIQRVIHNKADREEFGGKETADYRRLYIAASVPVILNELLWALGEAAVSMILGRMGTEVVSANAIYANISELAGVIVQGMNAAACVIAGNLVGEEAHEELRECKKLFIRVSIIFGVFGMAVMLIMRGFIVDFYKVGGRTKKYVRQIMAIGSVVEVGRSIETMNTMGILRGMGDVKFAMLNDFFFLWGFTVPFGALAALVWKLPVPAVYVILKLDQWLKIITSGLRLRKWSKTKVGAPAICYKSGGRT